MEDIHDILSPVWPPDYTNYFIVFWIFFLILILIFVKKFFFPNKNSEKDLEIEKNFFYSKEKFWEDFNKIKNFVIQKFWENGEKEDFEKNKFSEKYWKELSKILKNFIHYNHDEKIFFMTFLELKKRKKLKSLEKIFEKFDKQFYFYEKKWAKEFLELVWEIEKKFG